MNWRCSVAFMSNCLESKKLLASLHYFYAAKFSLRMRTGNRAAGAGTVSPSCAIPDRSWMIRLSHKRNTIKRLATAAIWIVFCLSQLVSIGTYWDVSLNVLVSLDKEMQSSLQYSPLL